MNGIIPLASYELDLFEQFFHVFHLSYKARHAAK